MEVIYDRRETCVYKAIISYLLWLIILIVKQVGEGRTQNAPF